MSIIGTITEYHGTEHKYLRGYPVKIIGIMRNGNCPEDADGEIPGYDYLDDDEVIAKTGGVTANDRVDVAPWLERKGEFSFASSDALATDLACFPTLG